MRCLDADLTDQQNCGIMNERFQEVIGKQVYYLRKTKGITQDDLAVRLNSHRENISKIERGQVDVKVSTLKKIADALEVDLNELVNRRKE
ncbi:MAG: helix-turn-helix transcriptional regulator [Salinivirgaceae bacterium]|jgi:HTH-type transcriptional repressor of puuD